MNYLQILQKYSKPWLFPGSDGVEYTALPHLPFHPSDDNDGLPEDREAGTYDSHHTQCHAIIRRWRRYGAIGAVMLGVLGLTVFLTFPATLHFGGVGISPISSTASEPSATPPALDSSKPSATPSALDSSKPSATPPALDSSDPSATPPALDPSDPSATPPALDPSDPSAIARTKVDALFGRQSSTLAQASGRYTLHTGREPPLYYANWYRFATEKGCLIDEYDQVHRDFKPFYELVALNATFFEDMIERAREAARIPDFETEIMELATMIIQDGQVSMEGFTHFEWDFLETARKFSRWLPDMTFLWNGKDGPRVTFNVRAPGALERAFLVHDSNPFQHLYRPTGEFFAHQSGCNVPMGPAGFMSSANNVSGFLIETNKPGYTTDLYPVLSMSKISPCFADIVYPSHFHYARSSWSGKYRYPDNIPWDKKQPKIYWRGTASGGTIVGNNYLNFTRFRLMDMGRQHPDLMDVRIATFDPIYCPRPCDREALMAEYNITEKKDPREHEYDFKYLLDVDGAAFSGRFLGLMRSGSLVFKSTIFEEFFTGWLRPFEHYVPVLPDLSDLIEKIEWANANPNEAWLIQQRGLETARRVLTDDQNDCYLYAALVEWAQLVDYSRLD
ncbi:CAP10 domain-containing protein [Mycena venus]|uniref:CAP10 domain-containing protein n=1 Tax=Mycena venus TaxID=2733690 RepID=A0A8H6XPD2_9AGAR|nr:CAP10 domain-containing protein [Mycena venus]